MSDSTNSNLNENLVELLKLIELMDEDSGNLTAPQAISDYIAPILTSMLAEIEANRQLMLNVSERTNLAMLMSERTFIGEILTNVAEHFTTIVDELPQDTSADSRLGVAVTEIQDLLATWMSFDLYDDSSDDDSSDDDPSDDDLSDDDSSDGDSNDDDSSDDVEESENSSDAES